jgi:hypothetical protein
MQDPGSYSETDVSIQGFPILICLRPKLTSPLQSTRNTAEERTLLNNAIRTIYFIVLKYVKGAVSVETKYIELYLLFRTRLSVLPPQPLTTAETFN